MAARLTGLLQASGEGDAALFEGDGVHGASHVASPKAHLLAKQYLQNLGGFISSREAEDRLYALGLGPMPGEEESFGGDSAQLVRRTIASKLTGAAQADVLITNCGMNAIYAAFCAVNQVQAPQGRTAWVQLGWLYLDTIAILKRFAASPSDYIHVSNVLDTEGLRKLFEERGPTLAGVVAEVPTNPLVQTPDVEALAVLCRSHGVKLVLDPSLASVFSIDCFAHADVVVTSLTKYTGGDGDIVAGALAVNPASPDSAAMRAAAAAALEPPYPRDLARLAAQIGNTEAVLARIEDGTPKVAAFLSSHPAVSRVHWALEPASRESFLRVARTPQSTGGIISFSVRGPIEAFYDRLMLPKGPSFGMRTTLICPFMYLAHYDLVTSEAGRRELEQNGLDPELLRLSVGTEPVDDIIGALREALAGL
jgi:cystathionine gamma-synthase